jgi:5-methylthioadenosine/S-adenosylhomocysteine deaminase
VSAATLVRHGIVLPCEGRRQLLDPGSVLLQGTDIVAVGPVDEIDADPRAAGAEVVDATGQAVIPGLHNCHLHSGLLRGTAESMSLWDWLENYVDPAHKVLTPEIAEAASYMAYTEGLLAGTVSVMDMWRFMAGSARAAEAIGIRATLVPYTADLYDYFETLETNRALLETHRTAADGRVRAWVGLEHIFYCSADMFRAAAALAEEFDTGIHTHSSESIWEVQESLRQFGRRPLEEFYNRGVLGPRTVVAHCVWLDDREIELLARTGTSVAHCPCSNMKLSSGPARIGDLRRAGIAVGLGSDGEKENNNLDLLEEMKFASLLQKVSTLDPTTGDPWDVLDMATLAGARALGLDAVTGSLEVGKRADVVTVDLRRLHCTPLLHGKYANVAAHLVFSASGHDVTNVWVDGRRLVADGAVTTVDVEAVRQRAQGAAEELFDRREAVLGRTPSPRNQLAAERDPPPESAARPPRGSSGGPVAAR